MISDYWKKKRQRTIKAVEMARMALCLVVFWGICTLCTSAWALNDMVSHWKFDGYLAVATSLTITIETNVPEGIYYVDGVNGRDDNNGLTPETAFATIQKGIDTATDGNNVIVYPAVYDEEIDFLGKAITVQGVPSRTGAPILQAPSDYAVSFYRLEGPDSLLKNFVIRGSDLGIFIVGSSPTISNVTVVNNMFGIAAYAGAKPDISNSIIWNNTDGDLFGDPIPLQVRYSFIQDVNEPNMPLAGLVSHWKFDEGSGTTAYDSAGNNHGIVNGATWTTGQINGALDFDGMNDYVDIPYDPSLDINSLQGISISVWINLNSYPTSFDQGPIFGLFVSTGDGTKNYLFIEKPLYGNLIAWDQYPPYYGAIRSIKPDLDTWYHVAVVEDSTYRAIYINGSLDVSDNIPEPYQGNTPDTIRIGKRADSIPFYFDGAIDDISIYNRVLSFGEIKQIYQPVGGPLFADAASGDYHLVSKRGRHWPAHDVWILDKVTSYCIDGGDPTVNPSNEPMPNGGRINMGAYGNTAYASMSEWPIAEDNNRDGVVNMLDIARLASKWLEKLDWVE